MFTGIIEAIGQIKSIESKGDNRIFWLSSAISDQLSIDQSVTHDGACLTVDALRPGEHRVTAVAETLSKTNLGAWKEGDLVNLERSMKMNGRLDGHIVQGHVDTVAECVSIDDKNGSWELAFRLQSGASSLTIEKGSICLNGISLTIFNVTEDGFTVAVIPFTYENTNISSVHVGHRVNIEFDIIGKYVKRMIQSTTAYNSR
jgi:riboflavin synthase